MNNMGNNINNNKKNQILLSGIVIVAVLFVLGVIRMPEQDGDRTGNGDYSYSQEYSQDTMVTPPGARMRTQKPCRNLFR